MGSNERIMKLMKEVSFLKKKLRIKEKGLMRGLDPSNITDSKRKRPDKFRKLKIENSFSNIPKPIVQSSPEKGGKISVKVSKERGLMRGLDPSNVIDTRRKKQDQFCNLKMKPIVQVPPKLIHCESKISVEIS